MKVLLAEDEQKLATALSFMLKKNGYVADIAPDGETALEMAATGVYDILVLDRILPFRDGLSVLKEYRKLGYDTPALFLTALFLFAVIDTSFKYLSVFIAVPLLLWLRFAVHLLVMLKLNLS